jgi:hypothetical protein
MPEKRSRRTVLSTVATFLQMALLLFVISKDTLLILTPAPLARGLIAILYGMLFTIAASKTTGEQATPRETGRAFSVYSAIALTLTLAFMLVAAAGLTPRARIGCSPFLKIKKSAAGAPKGDASQEA